MAYTMIQMNEQGDLSRPTVVNQIQQQVTGSTTSPVDVFIFIHGFWTNEKDAETSYNNFTTGFQQHLAALDGEQGLSLPKSSVAIGIHWKSVLTEQPNTLTDILMAFSFPNIRLLADETGSKGVCTLIRGIWQCGADNRRLRIHVLGHSLGCRVVAQAVCSALQVDSAPANPGTPGSTSPLAKILPNLDRLNIVLFQGAIDDNSLEHVEKYGIIGGSNLLPSQALVTCSQEDRLLQNKPSDVPGHKVLGFQGPTLATFTDQRSRFFDQEKIFAVDRNFTSQGVAERNERFIVADLTPLHRSHGSGSNGEWTGLGGHHSDIYCDEVYDLLAGFLFRS